MKKVIEEHLLLSKKMKSLLQNIDFSDTFSTTNHENNIQEITSLVFNTVPIWVKALMGFRNLIVKFLGLKTKLPDDYNDSFQQGGYVGLFKIFTIEDSQVVLGMDDFSSKL